MLNNNNERELAYVAKVTEILPIDGADKVEIAKINGWTCMVQKGAFKVGDLGIFFEADSKVPEKEPFLFMEKRHYKVKVQKFFKGTVISDGLLMTFEDFGWNQKDYNEGDFLTEKLGIKYASEEDNIRKARSNPNAKYQKMMNRHPKLARSKFGKWCMKHTFAKKILYLFLGNKKQDKKEQWPYWVRKTDEERFQNISSTEFENLRQYTFVATEKIDGTSTTMTLLKIGNNKYDYRVCSRNVCFGDEPNKNDKCYYDSNVYLEMSEKYNIKHVLESLFNDALIHNPELKYITLQGETYGNNIQKRDYSINYHDFVAFNLIYGFSNYSIRKNPIQMKKILDFYHVPSVPIVDYEFYIPEDLNEFHSICKGISEIDGKEREGLVFRSLDGIKSFKAVDNEFIMKYHN